MLAQSIDLCLTCTGSVCKNVLSASASKLVRAALDALEGLEVKVSARVTSLGTGRGAFT